MSSPLVFDRQAVRKNRERSVATFENYDFLHRACAEMIADRTADMARRFSTVAEIASGSDLLIPMIKEKLSPDAKVIQLDSAPGFANRFGASALADEEALPLASNSFDLIVSNLALHWVNDLPGTLAQIKAALKPDGLFIATLFGGDTLVTLYQALVQAETEVSGGIHPRVSPRLDLREAAGLLQRAGFALPVSDNQVFTVSYEHPIKLLMDLRGMGQANAHAKRSQNFSKREIFTQLEPTLRELGAYSGDRFSVDFDVITLTAWAPDKSQQKPLKPGQGEISLTEVFKTP